jgi:hypothetical protein
MRRNFYYGVFVFLFYVAISTIAVKMQNPNPLITSIIITIMTFVWFRFSANWEQLFTSIKDVLLNIIIYTFIVSLIAFLSAVFSGQEITLMNTILDVSGVVLWVFIWTDYYFQRMKGRF